MDLRGPVECDNCPPDNVALGYCPGIACPVDSDISVGWTNETSGASGPAASAIVPSCSCLFSYCFSGCHARWWATVPLDTGDNSIEVHATRPDGAFGSDGVVITRTAPAGG